MPSQQYIGRFAPSPTGPMHFGTLIAAVASYLQAKTHNGKWLVRIEDVDTSRAVNGASEKILNTLKAFGFHWDEEVTYQTQRISHYQSALEKLEKKNITFSCTCTRKVLSTLPTYNQTGIYPGTCRKSLPPANGECAIRLAVDSSTIQFTDAVMGLQKENLASQCGDFVIKRRDGLFAYQLAVVVDDALQGVTEVVRGADLLPSTSRQIHLQNCLNYSHPTYLHLPLALGLDGDKLSKLTAAKAINDECPIPVLIDALIHLGQQPPTTLLTKSVDEVWSWAVNHWNIKNIPRNNKQA